MRLPWPKGARELMRTAKGRENDDGHEMGNAVIHRPAGGYGFVARSRCRHCCRTVHVHAVRDRRRAPVAQVSGGYTWGCGRNRPPHVSGVPQFHTVDNGAAVAAAPPVSLVDYKARGLRPGPPPAAAPGPPPRRPEPGLRFLDL